VGLNLIFWILAAVVTPPVKVGPWEVSTQPGRVVVAQDAAVAWAGQHPTLVIRCRVYKESGKMGTVRDKEVYLFHDHGFLTEQSDVFARFDGAAAKKSWGNRSTDGKSFFLRGGDFGDSDKLVGRLLLHKTMSLVVQPDKADPLPEISFDLADLADALTSFKEQCPIKEKK
jgi:hypothetical protein